MIIKFYKGEIKDIFKAWLAISLVFAFANGFTYKVLLFSAIAVGSAFIIHELSHKFIAQKYGLLAYFKSFDNLLIFSIIISLFGLIFIAPGAVMIRGYDKIRTGRIAAAGPLSNFILGTFFLVLSLFFYPTFFSLAGRINAFLGLFNMIPLFMLDGKKIINWNKNIFYFMLIYGLILFVLV